MVRSLGFSALLAATSLSGLLAFGQSASGESADSIRGTVVNSVTRAPIARALVSSPDNRFATMTDGEGRFEFVFPPTSPAKAPDSGSSGSTVPDMGALQSVEGGVPSIENPVQTADNLAQVSASNRPYMLTARKPGYLQDPNNPGQNLTLTPAGKEVTIPLVPEAVIKGNVDLPSSEPPDRIQLQIFRQQVQNGRAQWVPAGSTMSKSNGEFRFADLPAGTYKLLTQELLDRDPQDFDPSGQLYGYPPVYYSNATDFEAATPIQISAGESAEVRLSLVKQRYHRVKVTVTDVLPGTGINVNVYSQGGRGPGYALGYNPREQAIEGLLPNGTYTVEAVSYGQTAAMGQVTLNVKGAAVEGLRMTLVPAGSINVMVREEFTSSTDNTGSMVWSNGARKFTVKGPRRYMNVMLESADDFGEGRGASPRAPTGPGDETLVLDNVAPGRYWVRVNSSRGYAASIRSGSTDLLHQALVVSPGGSAPAIEITMRDDTAQIDGTVEGLATPTGATQGAVPPNSSSFSQASPAHVYCIPLPDSTGDVAEVWVSPDGSFVSPPLTPGAYRLLAFDRPQPTLEYRNLEAMRAYDAKGPVVRLAGGQKEHVRLQLISTSD